MTNSYSFEWIKEWCQENGWTDLFLERRSYWAFPPGAVMPVPVPHQVLQEIKARKGLSPSEKVWQATAWGVALASVGFTYLSQSPMPLVAAFAFCAIAVAQLDVEDD